MAGTVGTPYEVMYRSRGRTDLLDIRGFVKKPDQSQVGPFSFIPGTGAFAGCYFMEYFSSNSDPSGRYFVRVFSPTEQLDTVMGFDLNSAGGGGGGSIVFNNTSSLDLVGLVKTDSFVGHVLEDDEPLIGTLREDVLEGFLSPEPSAVMIVNDTGVEGSVDSETIDLILEKE